MRIYRTIGRNDLGGKTMAGDHPGEEGVTMSTPRRIWTRPYRVLMLRGMQGLLCLFCDSVTFKQDDVREKYCAKCKCFLEE
jgi:hypothetical protein